MRPFRVYPDKKTLYYRVFVFPSLRKMRSWVAKARKNKNPGTWHGAEMIPATRCLGMVHHCDRVDFRKGKRARLHPEVGLILLVRGHHGGGVVSHEAAHAARYYFGRMRLKIEDPAQDEHFAWVVGNIVSQIGRKVW